MNNGLHVSYEKVYTDDIGKHLGDFNNSGISIMSMWENTIDAFSQYTFTNKFICLYGDVRIVVAYDEGNNNFRFSQYFLSGLDGKIITIEPEVWFGFHNLRNTEAIILNHTPNVKQIDEKRLSSKIFNWHLKR
jgi:dTDP-4-dehydrorhamnose 3,5-epimerase-like enzyme